MRVAVTSSCGSWCLNCQLERIEENNQADLFLWNQANARLAARRKEQWGVGFSIRTLSEIPGPINSELSDLFLWDCSIC